MNVYTVFESDQGHFRAHLRSIRRDYPRKYHRIAAKTSLLRGKFL